jgi:integrase
MRVGEACSLTWGDVSVSESRFYLVSANTKTRKRREIQVPTWLMETIAETCPPEDRIAERKVFLDANENGAQKQMRRVCQAAGLPRFSPHDLRHRRATIWHHDGVPIRVVADRLGHAKTSMTLDTYTQLVHPGEIETEQLALLVWSRCGLGAPDSAGEPH